MNYTKLITCRKCKKERQPKSRFFFLCRWCLHTEKNRIKKQNERKNFKSKIKIDDWIIAMYMQEFTCRGCNRQKEITLDHIVSICEGGENKFFNYQILCPGCHRIKSRIEESVRAKTKEKIKHGLHKYMKHSILFQDLDYCA